MVCLNTYCTDSNKHQKVPAICIFKTAIRINMIVIDGRGIFYLNGVLFFLIVCMVDLSIPLFSSSMSSLSCA